MSDQTFSSVLYIYSSYTKRQMGSLIRNKCIDEEKSKIDKISKDWSEATELLRHIESDDKGAADNCETSEISSSLIGAINLNPAIKNNFGNDVYEFKMVEIDNLVAIQRQVLLDFVDDLSKKIPKNPTEDDLLKICLIPEKLVPLPKVAHRDSKSLYISSPNQDLRFLGGYIKNEITRDDIESLGVGGFPTHAIMLFVGYGAGTMTAVSANGRIILMNGFHRAYTLRKKGIKKIPLLVKKIGNADLELPSNIKGLEKNYLLKHPRPILVKDFFNEDLVRVFKVKKSTSILNVKWDTEMVNLDL